MSPGDIGGSGSTVTARKTPIDAAIAGDNDWLGLAGGGNGQAASKGGGAAAPPAASGEDGVGAVRAPASSGSLLDDWAGGGGAKSAAEGLADRNQMLQQKVVVVVKVFVSLDHRVFWVCSHVLVVKAAAVACSDSMLCLNCTPRRSRLRLCSVTWSRTCNATDLQRPIYTVANDQILRGIS